MRQQSLHLSEKTHWHTAQAWSAQISLHYNMKINTSEKHYLHAIFQPGILMG